MRARSAAQELEAVEMHSAALKRAIWLFVALIGLAHVIMRMLEMSL